MSVSGCIEDRKFYRLTIRKKDNELLWQEIFPFKKFERGQSAINLVNADTTDFGVYGDSDSESNTGKIAITHGHPKDTR